jgi:hypothetical protein
MTSSKKAVAITKDQIDSMIQSIRGVRVMLDADLARIYGVSTSRFNEAVKRNKQRFPEDFMFQAHGRRRGCFKIANCDLKGRARPTPQVSPLRIHRAWRADGR